ncbi:glycosyltransferase family 4 protein [Acetobacter sp. DsW_059]|uniref:glycosyltransferase family 4 protein n=1 Tax=Acetobacter sp. DsW_059 TaxID=1670661 RepID=UPI000A3ADAAD|nr:glycosyltransferase family 4 protein [Acetobacter sp. DsW_059]
MKYLFVHQNFPGQYLHLVRHLAREEKHEIVFISEDNDNVISGVRRVRYRMPRPVAEGAHSGVKELEAGMIRAEAVAAAAVTLRQLGFTPDIIIGHHGWGELLNMQDVYPDVPVLGYFEFYYHSGPGFDVDFDPEFPMDQAFRSLVRAKNAINLLALNNPGYGQTPTLFQLSTYPDWAQKKIHVLKEGVNLEKCKADKTLARKDVVFGDITIKPKDKLVTYVARGLEPYRGFHVFMRALPSLLEQEPDVRVLLVGGDEISYGAKLPAGCWREIMLRELEGQTDLSRVHFLGKVQYETFLTLIKRSDAHVYLTYPFVVSWSLREAMAAGCAIVGSDTAPVRELIRDGETGVLVPFHEPEAIADGIVRVLNDKVLARTIRKGARAEAEHSLNIEHSIAEYKKLIDHIITDNASRLKKDKPEVISQEPASKKSHAVKAPARGKTTRKVASASAAASKKTSVRMPRNMKGRKAPLKPA